MIFKMFFHNHLIRSLLVLVMISSMLVPPGFCQDTEDSQTFISGFNAYQQKDYAGTIEKMNEVLQKYPDTPLRDMALFWLSRAYFRSGNQQDAARFMSQFSKEYPDNPLKATVEEELLSITARYDKGEKLPVGVPPLKSPDALAAQKQKAEQARLAKAKAEQERLAKEQAEQERLAKVRAEEERLAQAKADQERLAKEQAEKTRLASLKAEEEKKAAARTDQDKMAALKTEEARKAAAAAEAAKLAALQKEQERLAAEKAEQTRMAALKAEEERKAAEKKEQERLAKLRAEEERAAQVKAEQAQLAALKAEEERKAAAKTDQDKMAALKAEEARKAAAAAEAAKLAALQKEQERLAAEKAEQARQAALKAEQERRIAEKAERERIAALKAEEDRLAKIAAEQATLAALKAAEERRAAEQAEVQRMAALKAEEELRIAEKVEQQRLAALRDEDERASVVKAEQQRIEREKTEQMRIAAEKAAAEAEAARLSAANADKERIALAKAEEASQLKQREADEKARAEKAALREKAIAQYKSIIDRYPGSRQAVAAAAKLKELGVAVALPPQVAEVEQLPENAQVLRLEVAQFAGLDINLPQRPPAYIVGQRFSVPFEIVNRGNGDDSFSLQSAFPPEFNASFAAASLPEQSLNQTPTLAPGDMFKGVINLSLPVTSIDGLRITHPIKASSRLMGEATQSREVALTASAPLLRVVIKGDKTQPAPGDKMVYRVAVLNVGSSAAQDVSFRLDYPPQLDPLDSAAAGFRNDVKGSLQLDGLQVNSGESKEFTVTFQLKADSLAGQELTTRAELIINPLKTKVAFVSNASYVQAQRGVLVRSVSDRMVIIPGQTFTVPFVVTNTGNIREKFRIVSSVKGAQDAIIFHDLNRDGIRQANEPVVTEVGPLAPKEEAGIVMEIKTPRSAVDTSEGSIQVSFISEGDATRSAAGSAKLVYSRPVVQLTMTGREGRLKPGEVASFDLMIINKGSNIARLVELKSAWPDQLELVASEPAQTSVTNGTVIWRSKELGAGEKRNIKVSFRVKQGIGVGTSIQVKNILTYEDQLGNRY